LLAHRLAPHLSCAALDRQVAHILRLAGSRYGVALGERALGRARRGHREAAAIATKAQVERAIFEREGFRVEFEPFAGKRATLPPYDYVVMAPQRWKISDWKNGPLEPYRLLVKSAAVFRSDGTPIDRDLQLGNLRDTYYEDAYGPLKPTGGEDKADNVTRLSERRRQPRRPKG